MPRKAPSKPNESVQDVPVDLSGPRRSQRQKSNRSGQCYLSYLIVSICLSYAGGNANVSVAAKAKNMKASAAKKGKALSKKQPSSTGMCLYYGHYASIAMTRNGSKESKRDKDSKGSHRNQWV